MTTPTASQQFQRAVHGLPFTVDYVFELDGDSGPDAAPTYAVVNAEGATVATGTATLTTSAPLTASFALTAAELPERDFYTVTWSYTVDTAPVEVTSTVDVCDKRLFPLADYSQFNDPPVLNATATQLEQARREAEDFLERECGCAFTGRYAAENWLIERRRGGRYIGGVGFDGYGGPWHASSGPSQIPLRMPFVQTLRSVTRAWVDPATGATGTHALDLNYFQLDRHTSTLHYHRDPTDTFSGLYGELTIAYEHGRPLADVRRICLILARYRLVNGPLERRAVSISTQDGGSVALLTPGQASAVSGIPEVDTFIARYNARVDGFLGG